jgi:hypothetical protein
MKTSALVGGVAVASVAAVLSFALSGPTSAQPLSSPMQRISAVAASAKRALGPRVRYLSSAWQHALGIKARVEYLKSIGTPVDLSALAPAPMSAPLLTSRFGPVSSPPDFATAGTRYSGFTTNETSTAWCGNNVVVGFNDSGSPFESGGASVVGYSQSSNAGTLFTDEGFLPPFSTVGPTLLGDPIAVCNTANHFFLSAIWTNCQTIDPFTGVCVSGTNGVSFSKSNDGGVTFGDPVPVVAEDITQHIVDKDWMARDPKNPSNVFVTYTDFDITGSNPSCNTLGDILGSIQAVAFDTGGTPTATLQVAQGACNEVVQGSQVAAAADGSVYFAWEKISVDGVTREIDVAKSVYTPGAFGAPVLLHTFPLQCAGDCLQLQGMIRINEFPTLTVNKAGNIFIAWNDGDNPVPDSLALFTSGGLVAAYGFTDIKFSKSTDGGATWSAPVRVNTNPAPSVTDRFEPALAVGGGRLAICFYDRRNDPRNFLIDRFCANSTDSGATWTNTRITSRNFSSVTEQDFVLAPTYMGDYDTLTADELGLHTGFLGSYAINLPGYPTVKANTF